MSRRGELTLAGRFVAFLYNAAPAQYAFAALLQTGVLHKLTSPDRTWTEKSRDLIIILGSLFNRLPIHPSLAAAVSSGMGGEVKGTIVMPPIPSEARQVVDKLNEVGLCLFSAHAAAAMKRSPVEEARMPLSGSTRSVHTSEGFSMSSVVEGSQEKVQVADPLIALSGQADKFQNVDDLVRHANPKLKLQDTKVIPQMQVDYADGMLLNAAFLDFFNHGSGDLLETENGIHCSQVWHLLSDFVATLKYLDFGLSRMQRVDPLERNAPRLDCLSNALHKLHDEYSRRLDDWTEKKARQHDRE
jgi:hypothetical protein